MEPRDNYAIQAMQAKQRFLTYDQQELIQKLKLLPEGDYLCLQMLGRPYRIHRTTGSVEKWQKDAWVDGNSYGEVMTLLDLVCDSRPDRYLSCRWKNMQDFGLMFHRTLLEQKKDPIAEAFQADPEGFLKACMALGGKPLSMGDIAFAIELFDGLCIAVQLWFGDDEFPPNLRILWDENALMYLKYETMYFAKSLLLQQILEEMRA